MQNFKNIKIIATNLFFSVRSVAPKFATYFLDLDLPKSKEEQSGIPASPFLSLF